MWVVAAWSYTRIYPADIYVICNKHQEQVTRQALSFPRGRRDVGMRIGFTKRRTKHAPCICSSPVWPYLSISIYSSSGYNAPLTLHFRVLSWFNKAFVLCLYIAAAVTLLQIIEEKGLHWDLCHNIHPLINNVTWQGRSRGGQRNREDEEEELEQKSRSLCSLTDRLWKHKVRFMFCFDWAHVSAPWISHLISLLLHKPNNCTSPTAT